MTKQTTRRAVLAGAAALPALALPAIASEPEITADDFRQAYAQLDPKSQAFLRALVKEHDDENIINDPIWAAIQKHRKLNDAHIAACNATAVASEGVEGLTPTIKELEDQSGVACEVAINALAELLATTPTTIAGCAALLRHVENLTGKGSFEQGGLFEDWCEEIEEPAKSLLSRVAATLDRAVLS
jgi:hypothetical protein